MKKPGLSAPALWCVERGRRHFSSIICEPVDVFMMTVRIATQFARQSLKHRFNNSTDNTPFRWNAKV